MQGNTLVSIVGSLIGLVLLGIGILIGRRSLVATGDAPLDAGERERMLRLLHELGQWASDYSGDVSEYRERLGEVAQAVRESGEQQGSQNRVLMLLHQIIENSAQMQSRLDAAEKQLERQRSQIESYLSEARTDGLTGLANRRAFDRELEQMLAAFRKGGRSFVLALIDIDHFKAVNDTHGHQAGDRVLQHVAAMLRAELDETAMVARFGGEEFAILSHGPLREFAGRMNDLRRKLSCERIDCGDAVLEVTVSVGLSEPRDDLVVAPLIRRADEALYAAKKIGRNRVYFHDGQGPALVGAPEVMR